MRQPLPSLQSLIKRVQFTTSKRYQHKRVLTVVFLQSVQLHKIQKLFEYFVFDFMMLQDLQIIYQPHGGVPVDNKRK